MSERIKVGLMDYWSRKSENGKVTDQSGHTNVTERRGSATTERYGERTMRNTESVSGVAMVNEVFAIKLGVTK